MSEFEDFDPDTTDLRENSNIENNTLRKIGFGAIFIGNYDPADTFTYTEVLDLMSDPNEIRAVPGRKRSFL